MGDRVELIRQRNRQRLERLRRRRGASGATPAQQPSRAQQAARPPAPATAPARIVPEFSPRARNLGHLIALYLKGDWNYDDGMRVAREYAPAGTTEAELRAAVLVAAQEQGNERVTLTRALTQPEVLKPDVEPKDLPKQGAVRNVLRAVGAPAATTRAGATQLAARVNPRGIYGKETGEPHRAPQSFADAYASDPSMGSALELAFPNTPQWARVVAGAALDLITDPLNLLAASTVSRVARGATRAAPALAREVRAPARAAQAMQRAAQQVQRVSDAALRSTVRRVAERASGEALSRASGRQVVSRATARQAQRAYAGALTAPARDTETMGYLTRARELVSQAYRHDPELAQRVWSDVSEFVGRAIENRRALDARSLLRLMGRDSKADADALRRAAEYLSQGVQRGLQRIDDDAYRALQAVTPRTPSDVDVVDALQATRDTRSESAAIQALLQNLDELQRMRESPNLYQRALRVWKNTKTVYNLGTHVRNLAQNFILRWLTGEMDLGDYAQGVRYYLALRNPRLATLLRTDPDMLGRLRQLNLGGLPYERGVDLQGSVVDTVREAVAQAGDKRVAARVGAIAHALAERAYNAGDIVPAAIMDIADALRGRYSQVGRYRMDYSAAPETIQKLGYYGIVPFLSYQYFSLPLLLRGAVRAPQRLHALLRPWERGTRTTTGQGSALDDATMQKEQTKVKGTGQAVTLATYLPVDPQLGAGLFDLSKVPLLSVLDKARRRDAAGLLREFVPPSLVHAYYAVVGEMPSPQRPFSPARTRAQRILNALGVGVFPQPVRRPDTRMPTAQQLWRDASKSALQRAAEQVLDWLMERIDAK